MDPISFAGLIMQVGSVVWSLIDYGKTVKGASDDISKLSQELFALKGILEHLQSQFNSESLAGLTAYDPKTFTGMIESTDAFLQSLLSSLEKPKLRFKKSMQKLEWPFKKNEVDQHIARLERVKTWFILVLMTDALSASRDISSEINELTRSLKENLRLTKQNKFDEAHEDLLRWLAPTGPTDEHMRACKNRQPGTGKWFLNGPLSDWLKQPGTQNKLLCLRGKCKHI